MTKQKLISKIDQLIFDPRSNIFNKESKSQQILQVPTDFLFSLINGDRNFSLYPEYSKITDLTERINRYKPIDWIVIDYQTEKRKIININNTEIILLAMKMGIELLSVIVIHRKNQRFVRRFNPVEIEDLESKT